MNIITKLIINLLKFPLWGLGGFFFLLPIGGTGGFVSAQTLEDYLQIATKNNPGIKAAYAEFEAAMQEAPKVSSLPDPTLTASAFGGMETLMGTEEAKFQLMQMFPWFGTLGKKKDAAILMAKAKFQQYLNARKQVLYEVKSAYAELYVAGKIIELQEENLEILNSYRELTLSGFRSGNSAMVNVVRVDIESAGASTKIELLQEQLKPLKAQFNAILNRPPEAPVEIQDTLIFAKNKVLVNENIFFENHPTVLQFGKQQESYEIRQEVAKKEGLPMLGLGLGYTIMSKSPMAMQGMNGKDMVMPMFSISLPIFSKKYKAMRKEAEFMAEAMQEERQMQKNQLRSEYEMTLFELKRAKKLIDLYDRQIKSSQQANELLISGFANSTEDFEEVLQMNQDILMFRIEQLMAIREGFQAQARMEYLLSSKTE